MKLHQLKKIVFTLVIFFVFRIYAQVGIGTTTPNSKAILDLNTTNKGLLFPRMNTAQMNAITSVPAGLTIFNTDTGCLCNYNGITWINLCRSSSSVAIWIVNDSIFTSSGSKAKLPILDSGIYWKTTGNVGTTNSNFIGTKDAQQLRFKVNNRNSGLISDATGSNTTFGYLTADSVTGDNNSAFGHNALQSVFYGSFNTAVGYAAAKDLKYASGCVAIGNNAMLTNTAGEGGIAIGNNAMRYAHNTGTIFQCNNIAIGYESLRGSTTPANNSGNNNIAIGFQSMLSNTSGYSNAAIGSLALTNNTTGFYNTAIGHLSMQLNIAGKYNTSLGYRALYGNNTDYNTAIGAYTLTNTTTGSENTAIGNQVMQNNSSGVGNCAVGTIALFSNTTGNNNVAIGRQSLYLNATGSQNVAMGYQAAYGTGSNGNTAIGYRTFLNNATGDFNTFVGYNAGFNLVRGSRGVAYGTNAMYYGNSTNTLFINSNTAVGYECMMGSTTAANNTGLANVALGYFSLKNYTSADSNTGVGLASLLNTNSGSKNVAIGGNSLVANTTGVGNTAVGSNAMLANTSGNYNTAIGYLSRSTIANLKHASAIGAFAFVDTSNTMIFGRKDSVFRWGFGRGKVTSGAFQVGSTTKDGNGAYLSAGGTWTNVSDSNFKTQITSLNHKELLYQISQLKVNKWKYKGTSEFHIGPMAQDFYAVFRLGNNNISISTIDPSGIALAGIKALIEENTELKQRLEKLEKTILSLSK